MKFIGIDPGKGGALAVLHEDGSSIIYPFSVEGYKEILADLSVENFRCRAKCCLEHVNAMPGNGGVSMFHFGENFGFIQGLLTAYDIPYELVRPQKWKKFYGITSDKNTSIEVCHRLFPYVDLKRTERCKKMDDGFAESLLLAEYCRRVMK